MIDERFSSTCDILSPCAAASGALMVEGYGSADNMKEVTVLMKVVVRLL